MPKNDKLKLKIPSHADLDPPRAPSAPEPMAGAFSDHELEVAIEIARLAMIAATTREAKNAAWQEMGRLICLRTAARVEHMEVERGIR